MASREFEDQDIPTTVFAHLDGIAYEESNGDIIAAEADSTTNNMEDHLGGGGQGLENSELDLQSARVGLSETGVEDFDGVSSSGYPLSGRSNYHSYLCTGSKVKIPMSSSVSLGSDLLSQLQEQLSDLQSEDGNHAVENISPPSVQWEKPDGEHSVIEIIYCDIRNEGPGLHKMESTSISIDERETLKSWARSFFTCSEDSIIELSLASRLGTEAKGLIIGARKEDRHFIVQYEKELHFMCLVLSPDASLSEALQVCHKWLETQHKMSPQVAASHCLLSDTQRLDSWNARMANLLKSFQLVYLVSSELVTIKVIHCLDSVSEKAYFIDCLDTWSVREVKERFLQLYQRDFVGTVNHPDQLDIVNQGVQTSMTFDVLNQTVETSADVDVSTVWFTTLESVLPDDSERVLRNDQILKWRKTPVVDDNEQDFEVPSRNIVYASFQPQDSVIVKVNYRSRAKRGMNQKLERALVISRNVTCDRLRQEIAKIVHKDAFTFKLSINGKKIDSETNLEKLLTPDCKILVEQRSKINLTINTASSGHEIPKSMSFQMHKYDPVLKLKERICNELQVPLYAVDLFHSNNLLNDEHDLQASRLRDKDTLQALVLPNRIRLKVRIASGMWEDIVVNDQTVSTVGHLKAFVYFHFQERRSNLKNKVGECLDPFLATDFMTVNSSMAQAQSSHGTVEFMAIFRGEELCDEDTFRDCGVTMNSKIVMVWVERLCFTAGTNSTFPLYAVDQDQIVRRAVMFNGEIFFCETGFRAPAAVDVNKNVQSNPPLPTACYQRPGPGLQLCPPSQKKQFPPAFRLQDKSVYKLGQSFSMPDMSVTWTDSSVIHSSDICEFHDASQKTVAEKTDNVSESYDAFQKAVAEKTSTPSKTPGGGGGDIVDGLKPGLHSSNVNMNSSVLGNASTAHSQIVGATAGTEISVSTSVDASGSTEKDSGHYSGDFRGPSLSHINTQHCSQSLPQVSGEPLDLSVSWSTRDSSGSVLHGTSSSQSSGHPPAGQRPSPADDHFSCPAGHTQHNAKMGAQEMLNMGPFKTPNTLHTRTGRTRARLNTELAHVPTTPSPSVCNEQWRFPPHAVGHSLSQPAHSHGTVHSFSQQADPHGTGPSLSQLAAPPTVGHSLSQPAGKPVWPSCLSGQDGHAGLPSGYCSESETGNNRQDLMRKDYFCSAGYSSESEMGHYRNRKELGKKVFHQEESLEEDPNGRVIYHKRTHTMHQVDKEMQKQIAASLATAGPLMPSHPQPSTALVPYSGEQPKPSVSYRDTTFDYIDRRIIFMVANGLGHEGKMVILSLGVSDKDYTDAEAMNVGKPLFNIYNHCLGVWCRQYREKATVEALKNALKEVHRGDLIEQLDKFPDCPESPLPDGYMTA